MTGSAGTGNGITAEETLDCLRDLRKATGNKIKRRLQVIGPDGEPDPVFQREFNALNYAISIIAGRMGDKTPGKMKVRLDREEVEEIVRLINDDEPLDEQMLDRIGLYLQRILDYADEA